MREILLHLLLFHFFCGGDFLQMKKFFNDDEMTQEHGIRLPRDSQGVCNEDTLMNFLAEIQVINPESVMKLATLSEIEPTCKKVSENLEKIKGYVKTCRPENQPDLYMQLIKGVESLHEKLCTAGSAFRLKFEKVYQCAHELRNDFEECGGPADWNENSNSDEVCRAYRDIADCYYIKTAKVCGKDAASTVKELLESIIDSIIVSSCNVGSNPVVEDAMPEEYMKKVNAITASSPSRVPILMMIGGMVTATTTLSIFFL